MTHKLPPNTITKLSDIKNVSSEHEARRCGVYSSGKVLTMTYDYYGGNPLSIYGSLNKKKPLMASSPHGKDEIRQLQALLNVRYAIEMLNVAELDFLRVDDGWIAHAETIQLAEIVEEFNKSFNGGFELIYNKGR